MNEPADFRQDGRKLVLRRPVAALDLETTGVFIGLDRIVEIGVVRLRPDGKREQFYQRIHPEMKIPPEATAIHGIGDGDVASQPAFKEIAGKLAEFLEGCDLTGYNLQSFDLPILGKEFERAGVAFSLEGRRIVDAMEIFHMREPRDLRAAVKFYCGRQHDGAHSAANDALACLDVLEGEIRAYSDLPRNFDELFAFMQQSRRQRYLDSGRWFQSRYGEPVFARGRHAGKTVAQVAVEDREFLEKMLTFSDLPADTREIVKSAGC
jgi:DNA polymerase-3 subunit epsilon